MFLINKLNKPLSESLLDKLTSLGVIPVVEFEIPSRVSEINKLNPLWISGFITGEGSFTYFTRTRVNAAGDIVKDFTLAFEISQTSVDWLVLNSIANYFSQERVYNETRGISKYRLVAKDKIVSVLLPHFNKFPLEGNKALQYSAWIEIVSVLSKQVRTVQRDNVVEKHIKTLSSLNRII